MELLQLEHFKAVVEEKSFSRAARRVLRTQPTISQSIKKLEAEMGALLFARDVQEMVLTEAGRLLLAYANRMLRLRDETMQLMNVLKVSNRGSLSIAAPESAALYLLPGPLQEFLKKCPGIKVGVFRSRLEEIASQVMDREMDVGFVLEEPAFKEIERLPVHEDELVVVAPPDHPMSKRKSVPIRELGAERFVFHHSCTPTLETVTEIFARHKTALNIAAELWGWEIVKNFVRQGVGLAVLPRLTAKAELESGALGELRVRELRLRRRTYMIFRDPSLMTDPAREFVSVVRSYPWSRLEIAAPTRKGPEDGGSGTAASPRDGARSTRSHRRVAAGKERR